MHQDEAELRSRFQKMSDEEFSSIKRPDLTADAQRVYDEEIHHRGPRAVPQGQEHGNGSGVTQRIKRALGSIALWLELVWGLALVDYVLRDIGQRLPQGLVLFFAVLFMVGVTWWRIRGGTTRNGTLLLKGIGLLVVSSVIVLLISFGVTFGRTSARDTAEREMRPMPIERLANLTSDRSYCDDVVKIQGAVRELTAAEAAISGGTEAFALEGKSASIIVLQNKDFSHPKSSEQLEVIGVCKCSLRHDVYDTNIARVVLESKRSSR